MKYNSIQDILSICEETGKPFWRVIMEEDMQESAMSETSSFEKMREMYPDAQILPLDYDPDVSFANIENRLQMLIMNTKAVAEEERRQEEQKKTQQKGA